MTGIHTYDAGHQGIAWALDRRRLMGVSLNIRLEKPMADIYKGPGHILVLPERLENMRLPMALSP